MSNNKHEIKVSQSTTLRDKKFYPETTKLPDFLRPLFTQKYITKEGLQNLDTYQYHGSDLSWISNNWGQPFWRKAVLLLPTYLAPNMVTLIGFLAILLNYLLVLYYCSSMDCPMPRWIYLLSALVMFFYQTMDAIDGKQARRTKSSSPLGELFDHGCDAITIGIALITLATSCRVGGTFMFVILLSVIAIGFFFAQWDEYYTGEMVLGEFGVTEMELSVCFMYLVLFFIGNDFLSSTFLYFRLSNIILFGIFIAAIKTILTENVKHVRDFLKNDKNKYELALKSTIPTLALNVVIVTWVFFSPSQVLHTSRLQYVSFFIAIFNAALTGRQVLAKVCKMGDMYRPHFFLSPVLLGLFNALIIRSVSLDKFLIVFCALWALLAYLHFALSVIEEICQKIGINVFKIGHNGEYKNWIEYLKDYFAGKIKE